MSLINKQNCKALALEYAKEHCPHKTRISGEFIGELEKMVDLCVEAMVKDNTSGDSMTLVKTEWSERQLKKADNEWREQKEAEDEHE